MLTCHNIPGVEEKQEVGNFVFFFFETGGAKSFAPIH
jgi:hypothetical protein